MYFGSVRFFKHLIIVTIILMIIVPTAFSIVLVLKVQHLEAGTIYASTSDKDDLQKNIDLVLDPDPTENKEPAEEIKPVPIEEITESLSYQKLYPDLYAENRNITYKETDKKEKIAYLTFDDGPSQSTKKILDILDQYHIKATFFVIMKKDEDSKNLYKEIVNRGHAIGVHSASHDYAKIYKSVQAFLDDFEKMHRYIYDLTGVNTDLYRFPGGSVNGYNSQIYQEIISEMFRRGFICHDWNVSSGDTANSSNQEKVYNNVVLNIEKYNKSIILFHDSKYKSQVVSALPSIIEESIEKGCKFEKLDDTVKPYSFSYSN